MIYFFAFCLMLLSCLYADTGESRPRKLQEFESHGMSLELELITDNLDVPWGFDFISEDVMIVTERSRGIKLLRMSDGKIVDVQGVPQFYSSGQGGMLDIKVSPDFQKDKAVFFTYSVSMGQQNSTRLATAKLVAQKLENLTELFTAVSPGVRNIHFGSRIALDGNGYLFMTVGDRGERERAQSLKDHGGKVLRMKVDGSVPPDNPFVSKKGALPRIWSYGHRNPQGLTFDQVTGKLWLHEHGPRGGDEINIIEAGKNYGWPLITYGREYYGPKIGEGTHKKGMQQPIKFYVPSIAPSGMSFYHGKALGAWKGKLLIGALKLTHLNLLSFDRSGKIVQEERLFDDMNMRIRNVAVGPDDYVYLSSDSGKLMRIKPRKSVAIPKKKKNK